MSGPVFVGIDAGSSATKCVVVDGAGTVLAHAVVPSGFDYGEAGSAALGGALHGAGRQRAEVALCLATGYGRERIAFADERLTEITCHARGARAWNPELRHIIDIGGQDTKVIWINARGKMADYRMNAKCAAGTGTFLEAIALKLGLTLTELDELALHCRSQALLNSYCTVFAGTEVIERIKAGDAREDIAMGLFRAIATRVCEMMSSYDGLIGATGGVVAHCRAMVRALEEVFSTAVLLPPLPQHAGAYGAALLAREHATDPTRSTSHAEKG